MNIEKLLEAGVHFGHRVTKWNPRMAPFIYGERNGIHILDLVQTMQFLEETSEFLEKFKNEPNGRTFAKPKPMGRKKTLNGRDFDENSKNTDSGKPGAASRARKKMFFLSEPKNKQAISLKKRRIVLMVYHSRLTITCQLRWHYQVVVPKALNALL
jgi:hypothetical protein